MYIAAASPHHGKLGQILCRHKSMQLRGGQGDYAGLHQLKAWPILSERFVFCLYIKVFQERVSTALIEAFPPKCLYL